MVKCDDSLQAGSLKQSSFSERVQNQVIAGSQTYSGNIGGSIAKREKSSNQVQNEARKGTTSNHCLAPKLFWLDQYGSLQSLRYGAHGYGLNFALSILDQRYRSDMSREEAVCLIRECFRQLRQRYVINSPEMPRIKCVDIFGVRDAIGEC